MGFLYTLFIGIPYCLAVVTLGLLLCVIVIGIPLGLTCMALGFKGLTIAARKRPRSSTEPSPPAASGRGR